MYFERVRSIAIERLRREPLPRVGLRKRVKSALESACHIVCIDEISNADDVGRMAREVYSKAAFSRAVNEIVRELRGEI